MELDSFLNHQKIHHWYYYMERASQGLAKDSPTFKNFSLTAIHYLTAMTCGAGS